MIPTTVDVINTVDAYMGSDSGMPSHIVVDERESDGFLRIFSGDQSITHKFFNSKLFFNDFTKKCDKSCVKNRSRIIFSRITDNIDRNELFRRLKEMMVKCGPKPGECQDGNSVTFETVENVESVELQRERKDRDNNLYFQGVLCSKINYLDDANEYLLAMPGVLINENDPDLGQYFKAHKRFGVHCKFDKPICSPRTLKTELSLEQACLEDSNIMIKIT